jgi:hypothetical protein
MYQIDAEGRFYRSLKLAKFRQNKHERYYRFVTQWTFESGIRTHRGPDPTGHACVTQHKLQ